MNVIGITDFGDAAYDTDWLSWVEKKKPAILITKDVQKLLTDFPHLLIQNVIIHATITGYGGSPIEPAVSYPEVQLNFLADLKNKKKILIRIDPIIPIDETINQSKQVYLKALELGYERIRISIMDLYPHVLRRLEKVSPLISYQLRVLYNWDQCHSIGEHKDYMVHSDFALRKRIIDFFPKAEVCGEPGFRCCGCVSYKDLDLMGLKRVGYSKPEEKPREWCSCLEKKQLLKMNSYCPHGCVYCYIRKPEEEIG